MAGFSVAVPVLFFAVSAFVGAVGAQSAPPWAAAAEKAVLARQQKVRIPGLSCAIAVGDQLMFVRGYGLADIENDVLATGDTVYRLASISKPVTAVCAMRLVEEGRLDLDRSVHEIVPSWPEKRWPVTTRQLLAHLGGVRHYRAGEGESTKHYPDQISALERFAADPLLDEPGTRYRYSTFGYNLVAATIEAVTSRRFPDVVREFVAIPSGAATLQDDDVRRIVRGRAQGYVRLDGELQNSVLMDASYKLGGGGLCSSAADLARFGQALVAGKLVDPEGLEAMWTLQRLRPQAGQAAGEEVSYGLGFRVGQRDGRRVVSHSGAQSRVSTMFYLLPDDGIVVVLLCNLERVRLEGLAQELADLVVSTPR